MDFRCSWCQECFEALCGGVGVPRKSSERRLVCRLCIPDVVVGGRTVFNFVCCKPGERHRLRFRCVRQHACGNAFNGRALPGCAIAPQRACTHGITERVESLTSRSRNTRNDRVFHSVEILRFICSAIGNGEQRQARNCRRPARLYLDFANCVGRCRHECPTRIHAVVTPRNVGGASRFHWRGYNTNT